MLIQFVLQVFTSVASMAVRPNNLDGLTNMEIIRRYRFERDGIQYLETLRTGIQPHTGRHNSLSVREELQITLRFLATAEVQLNVSDIHHVGQSTVSKVISQVIIELSSPAIIQRFIDFPINAVHLDKQVQQFHGIAGFPKVVGVDTGSSEEEDAFVNRKGFHCINAQLVFNAFDEIVDVVARWPGSSHDSHILNSGLKHTFETDMIPAGYHMIGDSGYACKRWLLTPYVNPRPGAQNSYNRPHKITRSKVERGIGQLKRRFGILHGEILMRREKACRKERA